MADGPALETLPETPTKGQNANGKKTGGRAAASASPKASKPKKAKRAKKAAKKESKVVVSANQLPRKSLEQALRIPKTLRDTFAGGPTEWRELAGATKLSLAQHNKYYLWAALAYGLVEKEEEAYSISETGRKILAPTKPGEDKEAAVKAVLTPILFSRFFTDYNGSPFPADEHIGNVLEVRYQIPRERTEEAKTLLKENGLYAGILHPQADGTLLVALDAPGAPRRPAPPPAAEGETGGAAPAPTASTSDFATMCFIITPIGEDDSDERKHADVVLKNVIEPLMEEFGLKARRADQIDRSGIITQQIFECLAKAKVCVADLSFSNPNAFYELGVRHVCKLPTIQLIKKGDKIPFDVSQGRTIKLDFTDVYTVMDSVESAKRELREHLRHATSSEYKGDDNPVNVYLPGLEVRIPR